MTRRKAIEWIKGDLDAALESIKVANTEQAQMHMLAGLTRLLRVCISHEQILESAGIESKETDIDWGLPK